MAELTSMMNIGTGIACKLKAIGIDSSEKLCELGSKLTFQKLKEVYSNVCLVHLYSLEGAILNVPFHSLSVEKKKELKKFSDTLKITN